MPAESSLYDRGLVQGCVFVCDEQAVHDAIKNGRSAEDFRQKQVNSQTLLLVLSQNCDINSSGDKYIELISLKTKNNPSPRVQYVQNYRKLHFPFNGSYYECEAELISIVNKSVFDEVDFEIKGTLDNRTLDSVIDWRVGRYNRKPFPHNFNTDFIQNYLKANGNALGEYLEDNRDYIDHLHVFVKPDDVEDAEDYLVSMTALMFNDVDEEKRLEVESVLREHAGILHQADNRLTMVQMQDELVPDGFNGSLEFAIGPEDMSILDASISRRITLDYLCYTEECD